MKILSEINESAKHATDRAVKVIIIFFASYFPAQGHKKTIIFRIFRGHKKTTPVFTKYQEFHLCVYRDFRDFTSALSKKFFSFVKMAELKVSKCSFGCPMTKFQLDDLKNSKIWFVRLFVTPILRELQRQGEAN